MVRAFITDQVWIPILLIAALMLLDYRLSLTGLRWFRRGADAHYDLGGSYELNPPFVEDVESMRPFSPRHLLGMLRTAAIVFAVWWFTARVGQLEGVYMGVVGFFVLLQVPVQIRHVNNIALFRHVALHGEVTGKTSISRRLDLRLSGLLFWSFAAAYLLMYLMVWDGFFLGGVVGALLLGARFWIFAGEEGQGEPPPPS